MNKYQKPASCHRVYRDKATESVPMAVPAGKHVQLRGPVGYSVRRGRCVAVVCVQTRARTLVCVRVTVQCCLYQTV